MATPYDAALMNRDRLARGWTNRQLAKRAKVHPLTVTRFFKGEYQAPGTAAKLAKALGHELARYVPPVADSQPSVSGVVQ